MALDSSEIPGVVGDERAAVLAYRTGEQDVVVERGANPVELEPLAGRQGAKDSTRLLKGNRRGCQDRVALDERINPLVECGLDQSLTPARLQLEPYGRREVRLTEVAVVECIQRSAGPALM